MRLAEQTPRRDALVPCSCTSCHLVLLVSQVEALRQACTYDALPARGLADSAALTSDVVQFHRRKRESPPPYEGSTAGSEEAVTRQSPVDGRPVGQWPKGSRVRQAVVPDRRDAQSARIPETGRCGLRLRPVKCVLVLVNSWAFLRIPVRVTTYE